MGLFSKKSKIDFSQYPTVDFRQLEGYRQHPGGPAYEDWSALHAASNADDYGSRGSSTRSPGSSYYPSQCGSSHQHHGSTYYPVDSRQPTNSNYGTPLNSRQSPLPAYQTRSGQQSRSEMMAAPLHELSPPCKKCARKAQRSSKASSRQSSYLYADDEQSRLGLGIAAPNTQQKKESIKKWLNGCSHGSSR